MSSLPCSVPPISTFLYAKWGPLVRHLARQYRVAAPFPHIHLAPFFEPEMAKTIAKDFPQVRSAEWIHYKHGNEDKVGLSRRALFPSSIARVIDELNSPAFMSWLCELTGISNLMPDPSLEGGGLHQAQRGGFLNVHTDFSVHHHRRDWERRVNLIVYVTPGWREEWGGALEFWPSDMKQRAVQYFPNFNNAVIFNTDNYSLHGFPEPLRCPEDVSRRSLALYYYTFQRQARLKIRSTYYRPRPEDGLVKSLLIRFDTFVVNLYSKTKRRFRFSDRAASRLLATIASLTPGSRRLRS